jgi:hypothetical protein
MRCVESITGRTTQPSLNNSELDTEDVVSTTIQFLSGISAEPTLSMRVYRTAPISYYVARSAKRTGERVVLFPYPPLDGIPDTIVVRESFYSPLSLNWGVTRRNIRAIRLGG